MGLFDFFSAKPAQDAAAAQIAGIQAGYGQLSDLSNQGRTALTSNLTAGLQPSLQNVQAGQAGTDQLLRLLGIGPPGGAGGAGGGQDIQAALAATPGYQFQLQQGSENALRNAGAAGTLASGGTLAALDQYGQGLAGTTYQNAVNNLQPFLNYGTQNAGNVLQGYGALGSGLESSFQNQGNAAYGAQTGIGNANANAALAPYQASGNLWGLLGGALGLGSNLLGAGGGAGAKALFSGFGGGTK